MSGGTPRWRARMVGAQRDLRMLWASFRGDLGPALVARPDLPRAYAPAAPQASPWGTTALPSRAMRVIGRRQLTTDAVELTLAIEDAQPLDFTPGQFLTLLVAGADGVTRSRAYSICSAPGDRRTVAIAVKRVPGGAVSPHLVETTAIGAVLTVRGPSGQFGVGPVASAPPRLCLWAGGSGITPMRSIMRALLDGAPTTHVTLVFANRAADDIMFDEDLRAWVEAQPTQLRIRHVLEAGGPRADLTGLLDAAAVASLVADTPAELHLLCGPTGFVAAVRAGLSSAGVAAAAIREERFASSEASLAPPATTPTELRLIRGESVTLATVAPGQTLLEAGRAAGVDLPFSCTLGGCGACAAVLRSGEVVMAEPNCLSAEERARGVILPCVAQPRGPCALEVPT